MAPTKRLTDRTVLTAAQARPMTGDTLTAARSYLGFSAPTFATFLGVPTELITDLEAAGPHGTVPDDLADTITTRIAAALHVMTPAELRSARIALGLTLENLADATGVYYRRLQNSENGHIWITEEMRDKVNALLDRADADTAALTEHLRTLTRDGDGDGDGEATLWTYQNPADLAEAQAQLPPPPQSGPEDPVTTVLRSAPNYALHVNIAGRAARAAGARLRYV